MADLTDGLTVADPPPETSDPPEGESPPAADRETVRQAIAQLKDLPCSVPVVQKAIEAVQDPTCSNGQLELLLSADQGITTRLLRLANSAYFSVSREVSTLSMAVALIGYGRLQTILRHILVAEVFDLLSAKSPAASRIWKTAIAVGRGRKPLHGSSLLRRRPRGVARRRPASQRRRAGPAVPVPGSVSRRRRT